MTIGTRIDRTLEGIGKFFAPTGSSRWHSGPSLTAQIHPFRWSILIAVYGSGWFAVSIGPITLTIVISR